LIEHRKLSLAIAVVLMTVAVSAEPRDLAAELVPAKDALAAGDYETAYNQYRYFANEKDNPLAQFSVALFHDLGWGRPVEPVIACQWYEQSASGEIPQAQVRLADCLLKGVHRTADPTAAAEWYRRAADNGMPTALCELGKLYIAGDGVVKDSQRGLDLCRQAAELGNATAMTQLGQFYLHGDDEMRDVDQAYEWFSHAASSNSAEGMYFLATMMQEGRGPRATSEAARFWFESAAAKGYVPAYFRTAELYYRAEGDPQTGLITPEDLAKLYMWLHLTIKRSPTEIEQTEARKMLVEVMQLTPESWLPELDDKVANHLVEISPQE
jgi:TPR repeat protein